MKDWGKLDLAYQQCSNGKRQSPIDIRVLNTAVESSESEQEQQQARARLKIAIEDITMQPISFNYHVQNFSAVHSKYNVPNTGFLINNGHTAQVNVPHGSYIMHNGQPYHLQQLHFHCPSEHTLNGKRFAMEMHLVHQAEDGKYAVVAVWMDIPGKIKKTK